MYWVTNHQSYITYGGECESLPVETVHMLDDQSPRVIYLYKGEGEFGPVEQYMYWVISHQGVYYLWW